MAKKIWILLFLAFTCYSVVVYTQCDSKNTVALNAHISDGWGLWQDKNCQSCHQLYGLGGYMGPDLTNTASQKGTDYMRAIIKHGTGRMPDFQLSDSEVNELVTFLGWVDKSGQSVVKAEDVHWTGTYINKQ